MEKWDILDIDRRPTGRTRGRGEALEPGEYHLVVHVCVFSKDGHLLIQQRSQSKATWPGKWDLSVGGSALAGETSREAAARELKEELGVEFDFSGLRPKLTMHFDHGDRGFDDLYCIELELSPANLKLQKEEVQAVRWASREEVFAAIDDGTFVQYHKGLIDLLFSIGETWGSVTKE